jgi:hypothetical protein
MLLGVACMLALQLGCLQPTQVFHAREDGIDAVGLLADGVGGVLLRLWHAKQCHGHQGDYGKRGHDLYKQEAFNSLATRKWMVSISGGA